MLTWLYVHSLICFFVINNGRRYLTCAIHIWSSQWMMHFFCFLFFPFSPVFAHLRACMCVFICLSLPLHSISGLIVLSLYPFFTIPYPSAFVLMRPVEYRHHYPLSSQQLFVIHNYPLVSSGFVSACCQLKEFHLERQDDFCIIHSSVLGINSTSLSWLQCIT